MPTKQGTLYLSVIRDLFDLSIVAYKTSTRQSIKRGLDTIRTAIEKEEMCIRDRGVANHQHMARRIALGRKRRKAGLFGACVLAQNDVHMLDKAVALSLIHIF